MRLRHALARLPIRAKLTLAYCSAIALMLGAIGTFLTFYFRAGLDRELDAALRTRAREVSGALSHDGARALVDRRDLLGPGELVVQLLSRDGHLVLTSSPRAPRPLVGPSSARAAGERPVLIERREHTRLLVQRVQAGATAQVLVVQASLVQRERALELLNGALLAGGLLTLLVASLAGYVLAGAVLRPIEAMRGAAMRISDVDPEARLPLPLARDEVHRLGVTLNAMLGRVQHARDRERAFVSDASHELRTPLAVLKTEVEVALRSDNPPQALRDALSVVGEEADRLIQLAEDLLVVARSDAGRMELALEPIPVGPLLENVARRYRIRANEHDRPVVIDAPTNTTVTADRARVEQALGNLLENALRHGAGTITLRAVAADGHVDLHVIDDGPGFDPAFLPHAFERFTQQQTGRSGAGAGLGLSIVELIAAAHGGNASVRNREEARGTDAWLRLPR